MTIQMLRIYLLLALFFQGYDGVGAQEVAPWSSSKFHEILSDSKLQYPESSTALDNDELTSTENGYVKDIFYLRGKTETNQGVMVFKVSGKKNRCELRVLTNFETTTSSQKKIEGRVKIRSTGDTAPASITILQVHEDRKGSKPCARIYYHKPSDSMKVAIRKNPDEDPKHYLLGERKNSFKTVYFKVKNRKLTASYNGVPVSVTLDTTYDGAEMYFKAGAYNNNADGSSHVEYANLELSKIV